MKAHRDAHHRPEIGGELLRRTKTTADLARAGIDAARLERFIQRLQIADEEGCWPWLGVTVPGGYGRTRIGGGRSLLAHRLAFLLWRGDLGELLVCHRCDNPPCCNPAHLFLGTHKENTGDMLAKGRGAHDVPAEVVSAARAAMLSGVALRDAAATVGIGRERLRRALSGADIDVMRRARPATGRRGGPGICKPHLTEQQAVLVVQRRAAGESVDAVAEAFGVSKSCVNLIVSGRTWAASTAVQAARHG